MTYIVRYPDGTIGALVDSVPSEVLAPMHDRVHLYG